MTTGARIQWCLVVAVAVAGIVGRVPPASALEYTTGNYPYLCTLAAGAQPENCCASESATDCTPADPEEDEPEPTDRRNILLIISDDQGYCQYGFMAGVCSKGASANCWGDHECQPPHTMADLGHCVSTVEKGLCADGQTVCAVDGDCSAGTCNLTAELRLRLADPACRNRQPKVTSCTSGPAG